MKLTKRQRLNVYQAVLDAMPGLHYTCNPWFASEDENAQNIDAYGVCLLLDQAAIDLGYATPEIQEREYHLFPEFEVQKPKNGGHPFWWPDTPAGKQSRIRALKRAINLTISNQ